MKIILLRHGEPDIDTGLKVTPREYGDWLRVFNRASIKDTHLPCEDLKQLVQQCDYVICSHLSRSIDSARALGVSKIEISDPLFREFEMPYFSWKFPRLPATVWSVLFRLMWLAGYSSNAESSKLAKLRVVECMESLEQYAEKYGMVLFVGHGYLLRYLTKRLIANGWQGPKSSPRKYWEFCVYTF